MSMLSMRVWRFIIFALVEETHPVAAHEERGEQERNKTKNVRAV